LGAAPDVPLWLIALLLAAAAPVLVRVIHAGLVWRVRRRTLEVIARARACENAHGDGVDPSRVKVAPDAGSTDGSYR
jgi:hypothetical protein